MTKISNAEVAKAVYDHMDKQYAEKPTLKSSDLNQFCYSAAEVLAKSEEEPWAGWANAMMDSDMMADDWIARVALFISRWLKGIALDDQKDLLGDVRELREGIVTELQFSVYAALDKRHPEWATQGIKLDEANQATWIVSTARLLIAQDSDVEERDDIIKHAQNIEPYVKAWLQRSVLTQFVFENMGRTYGSAEPKWSASFYYWVSNEIGRLHEEDPEHVLAKFEDEDIGQALKYWQRKVWPNYQCQCETCRNVRQFKDAIESFVGDLSDNGDDEERYVSPFPKPNPQEQEVLEIFAEECSEGIKRATKMMRFGIEEKQPEHKYTNKQRLSHEIGDILETVEAMLRLGLADVREIEFGRASKRRKLRKFMQHPFEDAKKEAETAAVVTASKARALFSPDTAGPLLKHYPYLADLPASEAPRGRKYVHWAALVVSMDQPLQEFRIGWSDSPHTFEALAEAAPDIVNFYSAEVTRES